MKGHTPGPWHILCRAVNLDHSDASRTIAAESRPQAYGGQIARVGWSDLPEEETEANARLIAAAPELLNACKLALERFKKDGHGGRGIYTEPTTELPRGCQCGMCRDARKLQAEIAKAEDRAG